MAPREKIQPADSFSVLAVRLVNAGGLSAPVGSSRSRGKRYSRMQRVSGGGRRRVFRLPRLAAVRRRSELGGDLVKSRAAWKFTPLRLGNQTSEFLAGMGGRKLLCRGPLGDIYKAIGSAAGECAMQLQRDESRADSKIAAGGGPQLYKHSFSPFGNHKRVDQRNGTGMRLVRGHGGTSSWIDGIRHD